MIRAAIAHDTDTATAGAGSRIARGTIALRKGHIVKKKLALSSFAFASLLIVLGSSLLLGQRQRTSTAATSDVASYLPASDAVAIIDVKRLLNETMPSIVGSDPGKLAQANAEVDKFKVRTGIDLRSFDRVALGAHLTYPNANTTRLETVAIAHGTFNATSLAASARAAANGKAREEKYRGKTMTIIDVNDHMKMLGVWNMKINELAICVLDPNSLALGSPASVRAAIDAGKRGRASADLIALASRDANAVAGFGANVPRELLSKLDVGNDTIAKDVSSIQQVYGSIGSTPTDVSMLLVARTDGEQSAKNLGDTVQGLQQLGGLFIGRMAQPRKALAENALANLKITSRGNELEIRTQVTAANLAALIK